MWKSALVDRISVYKIKNALTCSKNIVLCFLENEVNFFHKHISSFNIFMEYGYFVKLDLVYVGFNTVPFNRILRPR